MSHPLIWFVTDKSGRWTELQNKLILNGLDYKGTLVAEDESSVLDNVQTCYAACIKAGAPPFKCPTKPHTYTEVVAILRKKGLIKSLCFHGAGTSSETQITEHNTKVMLKSKFHTYMTSFEPLSSQLV